VRPCPSGDRACSIARVKICDSVESALAGISDGMTLALGGFGVCGIPSVLIEGLSRTSVKGLTIASNNCGLDDAGAGLLLASKQVSRVIASYVGENKEFERQYLSGEITVELTPQGTLAERMRAGGAGIAGFYTQTGVGTQVADGGLPYRYASDGSVALASEPKETKTFDGKQYVLEEAIIADFALIRAHTVDEAGNVLFRRSSRNFNVVAAMSGRTTIVEAENVVPVGAIDPDQVHLPGVYVHRILALTPEQAAAKRIEKRTVQPRVEA
jgi:3-oxoacid CoA-transferase subunit A